MKTLVNTKSKKNDLKTVNFRKTLERGKSHNIAILPHEQDKRKLTKNPTSPKHFDFEKSDLLVTPLKDYQSEIISHKKGDSSMLMPPSPLIPRMSGILTSTQLIEIGNTSQIKVVARFRPLNSVEQELSTKNSGSICVKFLSDETVSVVNNMNTPTPFTLDRILDIETSQQKFYECVAKPTIMDVLNGYNGTIFAYGQSGSGKTFSMYGNDLYDDELKGIIPRSIEDIFLFINDDAHKEIKFELKFCLLEIYKENLHDLLNPEVKNSDLKIKEHPKKGIYVANLTEQYISSEEEFMILIENADDYRVVSETGLNKNSSRSHLVFQLEIIQKMPDDTEKRGMLYLVDLAGSEKVSKTHAVGETLEEAKKINLSLSALGNVISALTSHNSDHIPYRDSKLTRILQDSLGGNYKTTLIVACSPHIYNAEETISTLKFASRAKKIKNKVKMNIKRSAEQLEAIIENLNKQLKHANEEIYKLKMVKEPLNEDGIFPQSMIEGTISQIGEYTSVSDKTTMPNFLGLINHTKNKSDYDLQILISELKETIKINEDNIQTLNEKVETLQIDNKNLNDKIKINRKEIELNSLYNNLEVLSKKSIEDIKYFLNSGEGSRVKQLEAENAKLRETYRILESKYFNSLNEIEERIKLDNEYNIFDRSSIISIVNIDFDDEVKKIKLNMSNFFEENKDLMNGTVASYKNIYEHSKLYVNNLLKEFIKKKDMFGTKFGTDSKENLIFNELDKNSPTGNKNLKSDYLDLKNSYIKMSLLLTYYEKIIFDLLNKVLVDLKKFDVESQNKIAMEETCENFNKILNLYVDVLENIKELKQKKDNEDKKICNSNQYAHYYNFKDCIQEQLDETGQEDRDEVRDRKLTYHEKLLINFSPNGGMIRQPLFTDSDKSNVLDEEKFGKFDINIDYAKRKSSIKSPDVYLCKNRESQMSGNMIEGLQPNSAYSMKPYANSNIKRPVYKKSSSIGTRYHPLVARKLTCKYDNINDVLNNNSIANGNGNKMEDKNQVGDLVDNLQINNPNANYPHTNMFSIDDINEQNDLLNRRISRGNIKKTGFWNKYKESFVSTGSKRGKGDGVDLVSENKYLNKELAMYKNMVLSLSKQWSSRNSIDSEMNTIINDYKEDQKTLLVDEFDRVTQIMKIYKYFYEDELLAKRKMIEELAKIIDDLYVNNSPLEANMRDSSKQNGRCVSVPSGNIFSNYFNSNTQMQSFFNPPSLNNNTSSILNPTGQRNRLLINDYLEYKKEKVLNEHFYTEDDEVNNCSVMKIAESFINEGGTATKKMDYILFTMDKDFSQMKVVFGSGLGGNIPSKSPLYRNIKMSLIGDTHSDVESPEASD